MNIIDQYPQTVLWSQEDNACVGYCLSVFRGGVCHGDDPVDVLKALRELVEEELERLRTEGKPWPAPVGLPEPRQTIELLLPPLLKSRPLKMQALSPSLSTPG